MSFSGQNRAKYLVAKTCPKRKHSKRESKNRNGDSDEKPRKSRRKDKKEKFPSCVNDAKYYPKAVDASNKTPHSKLKKITFF